MDRGDRAMATSRTSRWVAHVVGVGLCRNKSLFIYCKGNLEESFFTGQVFLFYFREREVIRFSTW
jgi:hypothetical protein